MEDLKMNYEEFEHTQCYRLDTLTRVFYPGGTKMDSIFQPLSVPLGLLANYQPRDLGAYPRSELHDERHPPAS